MCTKALALMFGVLLASVGAAQPAPEENVDRVFHLTYTEGVQAQREMATAVRSVTDTPGLSLDEAQKTWNVRGTTTQVGAFAWLIGELDKPTSPPSQGGYWHEYQLPGGNEVVRVFFLRTTEPVENFQELATLLRTLADARRLYTYNALRAVTVRGPADQMALVEWLVHELDKPTDPESLAHQDSSSRGYQRVAGGDMFRVFYLPHSGTVAQFQKIVNEVRTAIPIRTYTYNAPRAVVFRGTVAQIAQADRMIQERDK
ncbi:MAG TPA: hypothetical protein VEU96_01275 [Bryobacteraceae bacterium]|nr:hypothetical protein [Bryobacteraceae bacterium]